MPSVSAASAEDAGCAVELECQGREVFRVASAAPTAVAEHDARLAAGQERRAPARQARLFGEPRVLAAELLRFVVEIVAELNDAIALLLEEFDRRRKGRRGRRDQVHRVVRELWIAGLRRLPLRVAQNVGQARSRRDTGTSRGCAAPRPASSGPARSVRRRLRRRRRRARRKSRTSRRAQGARRLRAGRPSSATDACARS